jgi:hypothetical protein
MVTAVGKYEAKQCLFFVHTITADENGKRKMNKIIVAKRPF